jgi:ABC-2 type transport system ATP-binding protein
MPNAIEITNLGKGYKEFSLDNVSLSLPMGHIMGFVGRNGAGKTTTIRLILNMTPRSSGSIKIFGMDNLADEQKVKQDIGVVFDDTFFADSWTALDVGAAVQGFYSKWNPGQYREYLKDFNLPLDKSVKELSRGMKMKLMLAVAMSHEARLLILDEPTSGIDPVARDELLEILQVYIKKGERSIFFSTHITTDLEKIADYISIIDNGKLAYTGTAKGLYEAFPGKPTIDDILVSISRQKHE